MTGIPSVWNYICNTRTLRHSSIQYAPNVPTHLRSTTQSSKSKHLFQNTIFSHSAKPSPRGPTPGNNQKKQTQPTQTDTVNPHNQTSNCKSWTAPHPLLMQSSVDDDIPQQQMYPYCCPVLCKPRYPSASARTTPHAISGHHLQFCCPCLG